MYNNIRIIASGQGEDCTIDCLLDHNYLNKYYKMIAVDLSKQQDFDVDRKAEQQISFTRNQTQEGSADTTMFFIYKRSERN